MTWSSYALEDLDDSFVANPDITGCLTASNTARKGDTIRHVDDQPVTLSCSNKVKICSSVNLASLQGQRQHMAHITSPIPWYLSKERT